MHSEYSLLFGKFISEWMTGIAVISEVVAVMYVVVSKAEKHVPCGELVGTTECKTLYPKSRANRRLYNRVQLYFVSEVQKFSKI